ncbi:hypothetical protein BH11BAC1_BH11BAC1_03180 [soil metagenome]
MINSIQEILERDLKKFSDEIQQYKDEALIWKTVNGISNSAGNLCLHICGNLRHFIGVTLGSDGYIRNREAEFALKNIPKDKLLAEIEVTIQSVKNTLTALDPEIMKKNYPLEVLGKITSTEYFLIHLIAHLDYHLGQINYHRRLVK